MPVDGEISPHLGIWEDYTSVYYTVLTPEETGYLHGDEMIRVFF